MPQNLLNIIRAIEFRICAHIAMALFTICGHDNKIEIVLEQRTGRISPHDGNFEGCISIRFRCQGYLAAVGPVAAPDGFGLVFGRLSIHTLRDVYDEDLLFALFERPTFPEPTVRFRKARYDDGVDEVGAASR